jgi:hypothetical protein
MAVPPEELDRHLLGRIGFAAIRTVDWADDGRPRWTSDVEEPSRKCREKSSEMSVTDLALR